MDLCILCGSDYCETIKGVGPVRALKWIKEYKSIEAGLPYVDKKTIVPESFPYIEAAKLFKVPSVLSSSEIKLAWKKPDFEGIINFLVNEKGFDLERIKSGLKRLEKATSLSSQKRLESFFTLTPMPSVSQNKKPVRKQKQKRKTEQKTESKKIKRIKRVAVTQLITNDREENKEVAEKDLFTDLNSCQLINKERNQEKEEEEEENFLKVVF